MPEELIQNPTDIRLNEQNEIQTILGRPPGWILRWGITFVFIVVMILLGIGYVVKFPDIIPARVTLTTQVPPVHLFARMSGKIVHLPVTDKQTVNAGALLAVLENPADFENVQQLDAFLLDLKSKENVDLTKINPPVNLLLGELQTAYSTFTQNLNAYTFFKNKDQVEKKVRAYKDQKRYLGQVNLSLKKQEANLKSQLKMAVDKRRRYQQLLDGGNVSLDQIESLDSEILKYKGEIETIPAQISQNKLKIKELDIQILDIKTSRTDDSNEKEIGLKENIEILQSAIENWKQKYLLLSPIEGTVSFPKIITSQQYINAGEEIMTIVPTGGVGEIVGRGLLPIAGSGKVVEGMEANIRLDGYPYQEFGSVKAVILSKSLVPQDGGMYLLEIQVPDQLITTYGRDILFQQEMQGTAQIITEDRRILERIFDKFLNLTKNR